MGGGSMPPRNTAAIRFSYAAIADALACHLARTTILFRSHFQDATQWREVLLTVREIQPSVTNRSLH
jgi:hypothetical protein